MQPWSARRWGWEEMDANKVVFFCSEEEDNHWRQRRHRKQESWGFRGYNAYRGAEIALCGIYKSWLELNLLFGHRVENFVVCIASLYLIAIWVRYIFISLTRFRNKRKCFEFCWHVFLLVYSSQAHVVSPSTTLVSTTTWLLGTHVPPAFKYCVSTRSPPPPKVSFWYKPEFVPIT